MENTIRIEHLPADVLGRSPIAQAALAGKLDRTLVPVPRKLDRFEPPPEKLDAEERLELASALERHLAPLTPHVAVVDAIRSLAKNGTCAVVTGQQPGFLASPLYSIYKALQSISLARALTRRFETPVVALFWNHADDHDLAEVNHAWIPNANLDLQKVALAGLASGRQPLSKIVLDDEAHRLAAIRALLAQTVHEEQFGERAVAALVPRHGETFARAFTRSMTELLGPLGLVVVEPDWIRASMSRELARIVARDPARHLAAGADRVRAAGFEVAIDPATAALVFAHEDKGRRALRSGGDGYRYDGEDGSRTGDELAAEIVQAPLAWSPGALLRPIVQDLVLPVVAYVGGAGELAYHAELGPLRAALDAPRTPFVPRISCTLVDAHMRFALARLETDVDAVLRARGALAVPGSAVATPDVIARMRALAHKIEAELDALRPELKELDPGMAIQLKRTADQARDLVEKLAEKTERVHQNKSGKGRRHERRVSNMIFPRGLPQERVLGPFTFVARHGEGWLAELATAMQPLASEHLVVQLPGLVREDGGGTE